MLFFLTKATGSLLAELINPQSAIGSPLITTCLHSLQATWWCYGAYIYKYVQCNMNYIHADGIHFFSHKI